MSISNAMANVSDNKLVIPCAGKMFKSSIENDDKALCFILNKGYIETDSIDSILNILDEFSNIKEIILVGNIEKVRLKESKTIVYRQRIFFKSLRKMLNTCRLLALKFEVTDDFWISINNIINCRDDLVYLERYAVKFAKTIDEWLTNCCIIQLYYLMRSMNINSNLLKRVNTTLHNNQGYLQRSPFLSASYSIDDKKSGIFLNFDVGDKCLLNGTSKLTLKSGYTDRNVEKDIREAVIW